MESPLKERLTGALIVVAVLVIVVPEMLSGPDSSTAAKSGGDTGPPVRTFSLELGGNATTRTQDQSALTPQSSEPPAPAPVEPDAAPVATVIVPEPATPVATGPQPAPPEVRASVSKPPAPPADVKPAAEPRPEPAAAAGKGQWWTQLGSFSARDNAERLARELRGKGYSISVGKLRVGGKDLYRVRAGPVASREAAVALQSRLAAAGHKSSLVPP